MRVRFAVEFNAILGVFGIEPHVNEVFRQHPFGKQGLCFFGTFTGAVLLVPALQAGLVADAGYGILQLDIRRIPR